MIYVMWQTIETVSTFEARPLFSDTIECKGFDRNAFSNSTPLKGGSSLSDNGLRLQVWDARPAGEQRGPAEDQQSADQRDEEDERADDRDGEGEPIHGRQAQGDGGVRRMDALLVSVYMAGGGGGGVFRDWLLFSCADQMEVKQARDMMLEANTQEYAFNFLQQSLQNKIHDAEVHGSMTWRSI